ncbi:MAG: UDP-3-O-[3-hydroxymyristoyl] N-acetylglucosamine deacetylase [bacterium]|nr:UDP-3-O-[3-hydroxymyristoyl] N-acetylglucosamine deacetylase [bacterium]MCP4799057.1 UDP-3-O-[3-hydroxymyristoyl] N-acetylglucosamine deacetylase [bacterium]
MLFLQKTVKETVIITGTGLHSGVDVTMKFQPAPINSGIVFKLSDGFEIPAVIENYDREASGNRNTTLSKDGKSVQTVEHVMSVLYGLGITNCVVELDANEPPEPKTGGVLEYLEAIDSVGILDQPMPATYHKIDVPVYMREGEVVIEAHPAPDTRVTFEIDYDDPLIGKHKSTFIITPEIFRTEIAPARTFAIKADIEKMQANNLAKGGSLDIALVVDNGKLVNDTELRYSDEFLRHKVLDLIGDLALLGMPLKGHVSAKFSGHDTNSKFVQILAKSERRASRIYPQRKPEYWDISAILETMPHRYPFLLVDRILEIEPSKRIVGIKNVTINEPFFTGHFPEHPIMPAVLITEAMAQVGGVLLLSSVPNPSSKLVYFSGIDNARFRKPVLPGDQIRFELELVKLRGPICKMKGIAYVDGNKVAEADLMSTIVDR